MDARIIKTKKKLWDALLELLERKRLNDVTISELCQRANVNRNTFYAHYSMPEDVFDEILTDVLDTQYSRIDPDAFSRTSLIESCAFVRDNRVVIRVLLDRDVNGVYTRKAIERSKEAVYERLRAKDPTITRRQAEYVNEYIGYGSAAVIKKWVDEGAKESPETIGILLQSISDNAVASWEKRS